MHCYECKNFSHQNGYFWWDNKWGHLPFNYWKQMMLQTWFPNPNNTISILRKIYEYHRERFPIRTSILNIIQGYSGQQSFHFVHTIRIKIMFHDTTRTKSKKKISERLQNLHKRVRVLIKDKSFNFHIDILGVILISFDKYFLVKSKGYSSVSLTQILFHELNNTYQDSLCKVPRLV